MRKTSAYPLLLILFFMYASTLACSLTGSSSQATLQAQQTELQKLNDQQTASALSATGAAQTQTAMPSPTHLPTATATLVPTATVTQTPTSIPTSTVT